MADGPAGDAVPPERAAELRDRAHPCPDTRNPPHRRPSRRARSSARPCGSHPGRRAGRASRRRPHLILGRPNAAPRRSHRVHRQARRGRRTRKTNGRRGGGVDELPSPITTECVLLTLITPGAPTCGSAPCVAGLTCAYERVRVTVSVRMPRAPWIDDAARDARATHRDESRAVLRDSGRRRRWPHRIPCAKASIGAYPASATPSAAIGRLASHVLPRGHRSPRVHPIQFGVPVVS